MFNVFYISKNKIRQTNWYAQSSRDYVIVENNDKRDIKAELCTYTLVQVIDIQ